MPTSGPAKEPARVAKTAGPVLLTGFEPFGGDAINPSWEVAARLHGETIAGYGVVAERLPCTFAGSVPALRRAMRRHRPALVIALGLAASRGAVGIERVAVNLIDARIADNAGAQPIDVPVQRGGPAARFSNLPVKAIAAALAAAGLPGEVSMSAGTYVCNQVFYALMRELARAPGRARGGFIHLPPLPGQRPAAGLALEEQLRAIRLAVQVALSTPADHTTSAGRID
jgi:pyroglutamyl-peptidase